VLPGTHLDAAMEALAKSAFSYSGQRCTAIRRFIVEKSLYAEFERKLTEAVAALRVGPPEDAATDIGPLISRRHQARVRQAIVQALAGGARILIGGEVPEGKEQGCWLRPALLAGASADSSIVRDETFGPVAVIQQAQDLEDAIRIANCVPHGLVAGLVGGDAADEARFLASIQAGIIKLGPGALPVHPDAPFGGWKASGIGLPEHGYWDREFYARPQVVYR
jgi:acyl-CoA reductase-like NAD-dependent aldehyde dehydrogenase